MVFVRMEFMEARNEKDFFGGKRFAKNLILSEEKDYPHLMGLIKKEVEGEVFSFGEDHLFTDVMNEIMQPSLFGGSKVFIITHCDAYTDDQWEMLFKEKEGSLFFFKKTAKKSLQDRFKKTGAILQLLEEKPWDRKNRLIAEAIYTLAKDGIVISQPVAALFVERVYTDLHLFHSELAKLRCYGIGKTKLDAVDVDALVKPLPEENAFKASEEILWKGKMLNNFSVDTISSLLQLLGAFRFQAYLGLKMTAREPSKVPLWQEKKHKQRAVTLGSSFFKKTLALLFKAEERAKQSKLSPSALFDLLSLEIIALSKTN
jgi:DNA polymerase III delta subunit